MGCHHPTSLLIWRTTARKLRAIRGLLVSTGSCEKPHSPRRLRFALDRALPPTSLRRNYNRVNDLRLLLVPFRRDPFSPRLFSPTSLPRGPTPVPTTSQRPYKRLTHSQLQCFCETARLGSMSAAAHALDLAQPTVWKQIQSLESRFRLRVVEPHSRGCRLTPQGETLYRLAKSLMEDLASLPERFDAALGSAPRRLTVCATPRPFDEELLPCVAAMEERNSALRMIARQVATRGEVLPAVQSGMADIGLVSLQPELLPPDVRAEPLYDLELVLLTRRGHPLTRGKLYLERLAQFPLLNTRTLYSDWGVAQALERVGAYNHPERRTELEMARSIRLYVQRGLGIGIVVRPRGAKPMGDVVETSLDKVFGIRMVMFAIFRLHSPADDLVQGFLSIAREVLNAETSSRPRKI